MFSVDKLSSTSMETTSVLILLTILCLTYLAWITLFRSDNAATPPLPPGPRPLPLVGNLLSLKPNLHVHFAELSKSYGPIFSLRLGTRLAVVITSPSAARPILKENDIIFANRDVLASASAATYGGMDIMWSPYGPEWRMLRKVCISKLQSNATFESGYALRREEVRKFVRSIYEKVGSETDVRVGVHSTLTSVMMNMMIGGTVKGDEMEAMGSKMKDLVSKLIELIAKPDVSDLFPLLARFDLQGIVRKVKVLAGNYDKLFDTIIDKATMSRRREVDGGMDFLQYLLKIRDEDAKIGLSNTKIKALFLDIMAGGIDSSSRTVDFAMAEILNKPQILRKIHQELDQVVGKDNMVEESHINKLPYLRSAMNETLRLHPVIPLLMPHCPSETCTVEGYTIPKGTRVFINAWSIQRDPLLWEYPLEFIPERFMGRRVDNSGNDLSYIPFGSGRRMCAGIAMSERLVLFMLATLLHSFDWKSPRGEEIYIEEEFGIVLMNKAPLILIPSPRLVNPRLYEQGENYFI